MASGKVNSSPREGSPAAQSRRVFLGLAAAGLVAAAGRPALASLVTPGRAERKLSFYNVHTGESLRVAYWAGGTWNEDGLHEIDRVLRDFRTGDVAAIDPDLIDLLFRLSARLDNDQPFHVISGYRSPKTNAALAAQSDGVAKHSLHMQAMAIDIRLPGTRLADLRRAAIGLKSGGVGYYPNSDFVHVDTGRVRTW